MGPARRVRRIRRIRRNRGPPRFSIVVLPFANIGGDPEQEYFVDGVTESLTTDLSRMSGMLVIGRNTAFTYKGKSVDLKQIGRELKVRYVLEGSVQRGGNRMRVNVQLIDAENGNHLWAERFDKPVADLFDMQDEIVARLAKALNAQLITAEARRAERAPRPDSMDHYFQGMAWLNRGLTPDYLTRAEDCFETGALARCGQPGGACQHCAGDCHFAGAHTADDRAGRMAAAEAFAARALSLAPDHPRGRMALGVAYMWNNRGAQGIANASGRWRSIEIWLPPMARLAWPKTMWVSGRRRGDVEEAFDQSSRYVRLFLDGVGGHRQGFSRPI